MDEGSKNIREILETPIEDYFDADWISARAFNLCQDNDILTVGDLIQYHQKKGLLSLRNCGKKSVAELTRIIDSVNFPNALQILEEQKHYIILPETIRDLFEHIYQAPISGYPEYYVKQFYCLFERPEEFYSFFCNKQYDLANRFSCVKALELKQYCYKMLINITESVKKKHLDGSCYYELLVIAKTILWFCNDPFAINLEEADQTIKIKKKLILADFNNRQTTLSSRAIKVLKTKAPTYLEVASILQLSESQWEDYFFTGKLMKRTSHELYAFLREIKKSLFNFENLDCREVGRRIITTDYPLLTEEECDFAYDYYRQNGHYPMFYILRQTLLKTDNNAEKTFADYTGIIDGQCKTQTEIAEAIGLTRERTRQYVFKASKKIFNDNNWIHYGFHEVDIITQDDVISKYQFVLYNEIASISFESFAIICSLGFPMWRGNYNGVMFLINNRFNKNIITPVCRKIEELWLKKRYKNSHFQLKTYLSELADTEKENYRKLLSYIINKAYGLALGKTGGLVFPKTRVNVVDELCKILREEGKPLDFTEMYSKLQQNNIGVKIPSQTNIKNVVLHSKKIRAIGKSSRYSLAEWGDVYLGSIRDLVADLLLETTEPMYIDDIMPKVWEVYPNTSKRSVSSSIRASEKFVSFGFGYFGLAEKEYENFVPKREPKKASTRTKHLKDKEAKTAIEYKKGKETKGSKKAKEAQTRSPESKEINPVVKKHKNSPQNETQIEFQRKCRQYLEFVISHSIPTPETNQYLFQWFNEVVTKIDRLEEEKRFYFKGMLAELRKRGINI